MTFPEFAQRLKSVIGGGANNHAFTKTLLETIISEKGLKLIDERSDSSYKAYYNGHSKITQLAEEIVQHIEPALFERYLRSLLEDESREFLCDRFSDVLTDANPYNIEEKIAELFVKILRQEAARNKNPFQRQISERESECTDKKITLMENDESDRPVIFEQYLNQLEKKYESLKTLLYTDTPHRFYDFYVCNDLRITKTYPNSTRRSIKKFKNITLNELLTFLRYPIIVGTGGIGKSMMMRHLLLDYLKTRQNPKSMPIFILLKNYTQKWPTLEAFIFHELEQSFSKSICNFIKEKQEEFFTVLFLDGLDEINYENRESFQSNLEQYISKYPRNYVIMSSRPGSTFLEFATFSIARICPLNKDQSMELIENLIFRPDDPSIKEKFLETLNAKLYRTHTEFASNPLLLTIMLITFEQFAEVPSKIHIFYQEAYIALSQKHDASKGAFKRQFLTQLNSNQLEDIIQVFCAKSYIAQKYEFTEKEFCELTNAIKTIDLSKYPSFTAHNFLKDLSDNLCLLYYESLKYHFIHRSFQEYFSACAFAELKDKELYKIGNLFDQKHMDTDITFPMLYDMIPSKVEEYIFMPLIEQLLFPDENKLIEIEKRFNAAKISITPDVAKYWYFLERVYCKIHYTNGEIYNPPSNHGVSYIYRFFASKEAFYHNDRDIDKMLDFDNLDYAIETQYPIRICEIRSIDTEKDDNINDYTSHDNVPEKPIGASYTFYLDDVLENPEQQSVLKFLLSEDCPFRKEYQGLKVHHKHLSETIHSDSDDLSSLF